MLSSLKKKLSTAIQDGIVISENLQQRYLQRANSSATATPTSSPTSPPSKSSSRYSSYVNLMSSSTKADTTDVDVPVNVNMAAGCNLLAKYEDDWKAIHDANEENGQKAAQVAAQIENIEKRISEQRIVLTDVITCLAGLPALVTKLKESMETLQQLEHLSAAADEKIEQLQDLCEECEQQEYVLHKQYELSQYQQQKMANLELFRQKVAAEHQDKIRQHEERLRKMQRERQAVFDDAFRVDLEEYKQTGTIPKKQIESPSNMLSLEDVNLDDTETKDALEEFLND